MDISYTDLTRGISAELGQLRSEIPDTLQAFHALGKAASSTISARPYQVSAYTAWVLLNWITVMPGRGQTLSATG